VARSDARHRAQSVTCDRTSALLADTVFPEAFEHGGRWVALATAIGFACAFLLNELTGST
jgi:hypothetical protein